MYKILRCQRGASQLIVAVIMAVMLATIAFGVLNTWKEPIKNLNESATSRLISND